MSEVHNVLFLCTGNSARSVMGEALLNSLGNGQFKAYSAGTDPKGEINPHTLDVLRAAGHDVSAWRSKSWDEFAKPDAPQLDFVITVCDGAAGESCPVWPGEPLLAHWGVADPAHATGSAAEIAVTFDDAYRMLKRRIELLLALPVARLDKMARPAPEGYRRNRYGTPLIVRVAVRRLICPAKTPCRLPDPRIALSLAPCLRSRPIPAGPFHGARPDRYDPD